MSERTALFVGRFQPIHYGHLKIIRKLSRQYYLVKIAIGSSDEGHTCKNPFTADERENMITKILEAENISNCSIYKIPDIPDDDKWVGHLKNIVGEFDVVYSGNSLVIRLFKEAGAEVMKIDEIKPYSATKIRERISRNDDVDDLVHDEAIRYMKRINGFQRIRKCFRDS